MNRPTKGQIALWMWKMNKYGEWGNATEPEKRKWIIWAINF